MDLVISPTLNEAGNVEGLVGQVLRHEGFQLLVVDDDSADGTWQLVRGMSRAEPRLHLLHRKENHGFRASYLDGFRLAAELGAERVYTMDADLSHNPSYLPALREALLAGADAAVGSRYTRGGGIDNWSFRRLALSRSANVFAKLASGLPVRDCTAGFIAMRRDILGKIDLTSLTCNGYGFLIELKYLLWRAGARFREVPIVFRDREHGQTKFNSGMIGEAIATCFRLRFSGKKTKPPRGGRGGGSAPPDTNRRE